MLCIGIFDHYACLVDLVKSSLETSTKKTLEDVVFFLGMKPSFCFSKGDSAMSVFGWNGQMIFIFTKRVGLC